MALSLESISQKAVIRAPRIFLLGVDKIGKSSFACGSRFEDGQLVEEGINKPVVLPIKGEEGVDDLSVPKFPTLETFSDVLEAVRILHRENHPHKTLVVDSATTLERLVWQHVCQAHKVESIEKVLGGYGKGYHEAASEFSYLLEGFDALRNEKGMSIVVIAHVKVKAFNDPTSDGYDTYKPDLNDQVGNMLLRWADLTLFANTKVVVKTEDSGFNKERARGLDTTGGARFCYTQKRPAHPGGGRGIYGELPYELPFDWASFEAAVGQVVDKRNAKKEATK